MLRCSGPDQRFPEPDGSAQVFYDNLLVTEERTTIVTEGEPVHQVVWLCINRLVMDWL